MYPSPASLPHCPQPCSGVYLGRPLERATASLHAVFLFSSTRLSRNCPALPWLSASDTWRLVGISLSGGGGGVCCLYLRAPTFPLVSLLVQAHSFTQFSLPPLVRLTSGFLYQFFSDSVRFLLPRSSPNYLLAAPANLCLRPFFARFYLNIRLLPCPLISVVGACFPIFVFLFFSPYWFCVIANLY